MDLYYGGEMLSSDQPQSFTCPYCKKMGFSDSTLLEHVGAEHTDTGLEVVCPVCAGQPGGEPNLVTDDFAGHLTLEHRTGPRDLISFLDEPSAIRHGGVRRIPGRALGGTRSRRSNMHFGSSSGLSALSPSGRESDPIAELLSQLSGVRRGAPQPSQLQQLQMQIQLERQQVSATRQQLERLPRRQAHPVVSSSNSNVPMQEAIASGSGATNGSNSVGVGLVSSSTTQQPQSSIAVTSINNAREVPLSSSSLPLAVTTIGLSGVQGSNSGDIQSQFLLAKFMSPTLEESELEQLEMDRADRSQYVQALMLSTLSNIQQRNECDSQQRGESQETNSDNVNSETNNESGDDTSYCMDEKNSKIDGCHGATGRASEQQQQQQQQWQSPYSTVLKKKMAVAGKSNSSQNATMIHELLRPPPPPSGGPQQAQTRLPREIKSTSMSSKEIPDSR